MTIHGARVEVICLLCGEATKQLPSRAGKFCPALLMKAAEYLLSGGVALVEKEAVRV
jgi:hypothetical protein